MSSTRAPARSHPQAVRLPPLPLRGRKQADEGTAVPIPVPLAVAAQAEGITEILIGEWELQQRIRVMGTAIAQHYGDRRPLLVGLLRGSAVFMADLLRAIEIPVMLDFLAVSSYMGQASSGVVRLLKDLDHTITDRHVLLVEDIIDTGLTLNYVMRILETRRPASLKLCTLLNKPARRLIERPVDFLGFDIPDSFVVGYGLDYNQRYRNLPYIAVLQG